MIKPDTAACDNFAIIIFDDQIGAGNFFNHAGYVAQFIRGKIVRHMTLKNFEADSFLFNFVIATFHFPRWSALRESFVKQAKIAMMIFRFSTALTSSLRQAQTCE